MLPVLERIRALQRDAEDFNAPMELSGADLKAFGDYMEMQDKLLRAARLILRADGRAPAKLNRTRLDLLAELDDVLGPLPKVHFTHGGNSPACAVDSDRNVRPKLTTDTRQVTCGNCRRMLEASKG